MYIENEKGKRNDYENNNSKDHLLYSSVFRKKKMLTFSLMMKSILLLKNLKLLLGIMKKILLLERLLRILLKDLKYLKIAVQTMNFQT